MCDRKRFTGFLPEEIQTTPSKTFGSISHYLVTHILTRLTENMSLYKLRKYM